MKEEPLSIIEVLMATEQLGGEGKVEVRTEWYDGGRRWITVYSVLALADAMRGLTDRSHPLEVFGVRRRGHEEA